MLDKWFSYALGDRDVATRQLREIQRIGGGLADGDVPKGGGDADKINAWVRHGKTQRHRIVHTGIGVENDAVVERVRHKTVKQVPQEIRPRSA